MCLGVCGLGFCLIVCCLFVYLSQGTQAFEVLCIQNEGEMYLLTRRHMVECSDKGVLSCCSNLFVTIKLVSRCWVDTI